MPGVFGNQPLQNTSRLHSLTTAFGLLVDASSGSC
jgi:hypothetical protein